MSEFETKASKGEPAFTGRLQPVKSIASVDGQLERNFSGLSCIGLAFALLNSWTAMSASLGIILPSGGAQAVVFGLIVSAAGSLSMAASLAELCHVYSTTGGQFDWTWILAPASCRRALTYFEGWMAVAGWVSLVATGSSLGANFCIDLIALWDTSYESKPYQIFLVYLAFTLGATALNVFGVRLLPHVDRTAFIWSLAGLVTVMITLLATARGEYQPASFVFGNFTNRTGWPDGWAFIIGLLQSTFGLTGFDAVCHLSDEMVRPSINGPRVMVGAVLIGASTSWFFLVVILFCLRDFDQVIESTAGSLIEVYFQATSSRVGATCLVMFNVCAMAFATQGLMTAGSRMVFSHARDRGFARLSEPLGRVHPKLKVPVWSVLFTAIWVIIFGLVFLGSDVALNAILSASVCFLQLSYLIPIALILWRGEAGLELATHGKRTLSLGKFRRPINAFALAFALLTTAAFLFPPSADPTGSSMNYVCVVIGIVFIMCAVAWLIDGRANFSGPSDLEARLQAAARLSHEEDVEL